MKIAYLVNTYPRPSQTFIRREIQALERQGVTVHRFAMRSDRAALVEPADKDEDARTEHVLEMGAVRLISLALGWMVSRPGASWRALGQALRCGKVGGAASGGRLRHLIYLIEAAYIARRCRALGVEHLHAHFGTNSTTVAMLSHLLGGPRYSFTTHGPEEFDAPVVLSLGDKISNAAFTVAISSFGRSQLSRWTSVENWPRIKIVHCGIDPTRFETTHPIPEGGPHLVAIGRLAEQKGFSLLIDAMALAAPKLPDLRLTLLGDGPLRPVLEAGIAARGLGDVIHLAGWADEAVVRATLDTAQALILPSFAEGLPMVVMEAMAAGRPVIATAIAGIPELVHNGREGWVVPAGDAAALADAILALAETPLPRLAEMGVAARTRSLQRHDVNQEAAKLAALFKA
ncbi:MAG: glycosyltransferase, partial [Pseudorhodobacter sp.]